MANNYAIIVCYSISGARQISKCIGTVNSRKKADKYARLLRMTGNIETEIKKQKHKVPRDYRLNYVIRPENEDKIKIAAIETI